MDWHQMFELLSPRVRLTAQGGASISTDVNLHVYTNACREVARMLACRNWLRSNESDLKLYERTKRDLASRPWKYAAELRRRQT
jgi:GrpB-like predicted nucleotidyltransferase (UPF0157 family)